MKYSLILLSFLFCFSCKNSDLERSGKYYPGEYRSELNIGANSEITLSINNAVSGDQVDVFVTAYDTLGQKVNVGGSNLSLYKYSGVGSFSILEAIDNNDGTYFFKISVEKAGTFSIGITSFNKKISGSQSIDISVTPNVFNLDKSLVVISRANFLVDDQADVFFYPRDLNYNLIMDPNLSIFSTIVGGTSQASITGFTYQSGIYKAVVTANSVGTPTELNLSVRNQGIIKPKTKISVATTKPNYSNSVIRFSKRQFSVDEKIALTIEVRNSSNASSGAAGVPIIMEVDDPTILEFEDVNINIVNVIGLKAGTARVKAKVDGEYINAVNEITLQVVP